MPKGEGDSLYYVAKLPFPMEATGIPNCVFVMLESGPLDAAGALERLAELARSGGHGDQGTTCSSTTAPPAPGPSFRDIIVLPTTFSRIHLPGSTSGTGASTFFLLSALEVGPALQRKQLLAPDYNVRPRTYY